LSQFNTTSNLSFAGNFARPGLTTVFFDMGSTLADLNPSYEGIYHRIFQKAGYDLPLGEVESAIAYSWDIVTEQDAVTAYDNTLEGTLNWQREVEERVMERLNIHPDVREDVFWNIIQAFEDPAAYRLYDDALPTLATLKQAGYRLAIISNWSWHLPELCGALGLASYFEQIFTSARVGFAKPHPEIFTHALAGMNIGPDQAIHIGDSFKADVMGANGVGLQPVWLRRPDKLPLYADQTDAPPGPTPVVRGLEEVITLLRVSQPEKKRIR
jgi:putative hydrolase of the HAD superfamily